MGCVYKITNKENGKFYIGSTCDFKRRMREHFGELNRNEHNSKEMQDDYNTFGRDSFIVEIIENCENTVLREREQFYLDELKAVENGYNISISSYSNVSASNPFMGDVCGEKNPFYGHHHSEETKRKDSEWHKAHVGWKHSDETKLKMSKSATGKNNSNATRILQYDLDMNFIKEWDCVADICKYYGWKSHTHITNCCKRNVLHKRKKWSTGKGFIWMYKDEPKRKKVV